MDIILFFVWTISGITPIVRWSFGLAVNETSLTSDLEVIQKFLLDNLNQVCTSPLVVRCSPDLLRRTLEETTSHGPLMEIQKDLPSPVWQMITPGPTQPRRFIFLFDLQTKHQSPSLRFLPC